MNTGYTHTIQHIVTDAETALAVGSGGLEVYATPAMISLMEKTAYLAAAKHGLQTVGTKVNISHLRACKPGETIICVAEVTEVDGRRIAFSIKTSDSKGIIGEGTHERFAIDPERFMAKLG